MRTQLSRSPGAVRHPSAEHPQGRVETPGRVFSLVAIWSSCGWANCEKSMPFKPSSFVGHATNPTERPPSQRASRQARTGETARSRIAGEPTACLQTLDSKLDPKEQLGIPQSHKKPEKSGFCSSGKQVLVRSVERDSRGRGRIRGRSAS